MSYIASILKDKYLSKVKTTKDLIYKDKIVDIHNIASSYEQILKDSSKNSLFMKSFLKYGDCSYFYNESISIAFEISALNLDLSKFLEPAQENLEKFKIYKTNELLISEIHNSLWIEGIRSSKKKIHQIVKDGMSYSSKHGDMTSVIINNFKVALNFVLTTDKINEQNFYALYTILTKDIVMGENQLDDFPYRKTDVTIGNENTKGIDPKNIKKSMDKIFEFIEEEELLDVNAKRISDFSYFLNSLLIHLNFEHIHPYYDMNGRMGRLLSLWYMKNNNVLFEGLYFSEAINLFKHEFYYPAFKEIEINEFKFDATYFVSSLASALLAHKICKLLTNSINNTIRDSFSEKLNKFEDDIIMSLLSKDKDKYYIAEAFILGIEDINKAIVSKSLTKLVKFNILKEVNSKPKEYKLNWTDDMEALINKLILKKQ